MANWCIRLAEEYLSVLYDHLHKVLYSYHVIQADETPVLVNHDGRKAGSKSWMWVIVPDICIKIDRLSCMNTSRREMHPIHGNS